MAKMTLQLDDMFNTLSRGNNAKTEPDVIKQNNNITTQQNNNITKEQENTQIVPKQRTSVKRPGRPPKTDVDEQKYFVHCRIGTEFKIAIAEYCFEHHIKEVALVQEVVYEIVNAENVKDYLSPIYNTDDKGRDNGKHIIKPISEDMKKHFMLLAKKNNISEGDLLAQGIAQKIKWRKIR